VWLFKRERERRLLFNAEEGVFLLRRYVKSIQKGERRVKTRNFVFFFSSKTIVIFCLKSLSVCLC
jgi:hypothetical protein